VYSKGDGGGESSALKRTASSLKEVGRGGNGVNDILVKTSSYTIIISIIIISLLKHLFIRVTAKADKSTLMVAGRRGKGASP